MLSIAALALLAVAPFEFPGCKASKQESGSLHASTSFEVTVTTPKSKLKQQLDCGGKTVTLFISEFATPALADEAANLTGPQLWGGTAPTAEDPDELLLKGTMQVVISGPALRSAADALAAKGFKPWRGGAPTDVLERVAKALDCKPASKDSLRAWCAASMTSSAGFKSAKNDTVLLGISTPLAASKEVREELLRATRVSALAFSNGKVRLTDVTPDNDAEAKQLLEVAGEVGAALKGMSSSVKLGADLAGFLPVLAGQCAKGGAAVKDVAKGPAQVTLKNPTRMWLVKSGKSEVYVVSEDAPDGAWLSIYPVVPSVTK